MIQRLLMNLLLALLWASTIGPFTPANVLVGFVVGFVVLLVASPVDKRDSYSKRVMGTIGFLAYLVYELAKANVLVAWWTISPLKRLSPALIVMPLDEGMTDAEITVLSNVITLTPGTLSLDVSPDRRLLTVHCMHAPDPEAVRREIHEGFQRRLLEVTR